MTTNNRYHRASSKYHVEEWGGRSQTRPHLRHPRPWRTPSTSNCMSSCRAGSCSPASRRPNSVPCPVGGPGKAAKDTRVAPATPGKAATCSSRGDKNIVGVCASPVNASMDVGKDSASPARHKSMRRHRKHWTRATFRAHDSRRMHRRAARCAMRRPDRDRRRTSCLKIGEKTMLATSPRQAERRPAKREAPCRAGSPPVPGAGCQTTRTEHWFILVYQHVLRWPRAPSGGQHAPQSKNCCTSLPSLLDIPELHWRCSIRTCSGHS